MHADKYHKIDNPIPELYAGCKKNGSSKELSTYTVIQLYSYTVTMSYVTNTYA